MISRQMTALTSRKSSKQVKPFPNRMSKPAITKAFMKKPDLHQQAHIGDKVTSLVNQGPGTNNEFLPPVPGSYMQAMKQNSISYAKSTSIFNPKKSFQRES